MICKICGTDIKNAVFCPMCGAKKGSEVNTEVDVETSTCYPKYQGMDIDSTTVLTSEDMYHIHKDNQFENNKSGDRDDIKKDTSMQEKKEFRVVDAKPMKKTKKDRKKIIIIVVSIAIAVVIALTILIYYFLLSKNNVVYNNKIIYYKEQAHIYNTDGLKIDYSAYVNAQPFKNDYENNICLLKDAGTNQVILASEKNVVKIGEPSTLQQLVYGNQLNKLFYFVSENTAEDGLFQYSNGAEKEIAKGITNLVSSGISEDGKYMAYSYRNGENSFVICEVLPSGEVNQIATLDTSASIIYVSNEGKIFCSLLQKKNSGNEKEKEKDSYLIYQVQDKKTYGSAILGIKYFGYYSNLDAYILEDSESNLFYVDMKDNGKEKLLASGIGWFMDVSGGQKSQNSCNQQAVINGQINTTLQTKMPLIIYFKDNTLYWNDVSNGNESKKIVDNIQNIENLQIWNNNQIFYENNQNLYKTVFEKGEWQPPIMIHKNCSQFQYMTTDNALIYLSDNKLYVFSKGKENKISDNVVSFDTDSKNGNLLFSTKGSLFYLKNITKSGKEYHIASEGNVFLRDNTVYFTNINGGFNQMDLKTLEQKEIVKNPEDITVIWR